MGLKKPPEWRKDPRSGSLAANPDRGKSTRFRPGHPSWNKGKKFNAGGRSRQTQFKQGHRPHTWVPVGSYRITKDGLVQRKINDNPGPNNVRWRSVHELVWIEHNGPVPAGHICIFKPGQRTTDPEQITI